MAEKTEKKEEAAAVKKKPPMMIIIAVLAVVVLGAGFFAVQKVSAKSKTGAVKKVEKGPVLTLDEFLVNLADTGGDHFLKVTVGLELSKEKGKTPEVPQGRHAPDSRCRAVVPCQQDAGSNWPGDGPGKAQGRD